MIYHSTHMQILFQLVRVIPRITNIIMNVHILVKVFFFLLLQLIKVEFDLVYLWNNIFHINICHQFFLNKKVTIYVT